MRHANLVILADRPTPDSAMPGLHSEYSPAQRFAIGEFLIRATVELAASTWPGPVHIYGAPDIDHPLFAALADEFEVRLKPQASGDIGSRMAAALDGVLASGVAGAAITCDVPHCFWDVLDDANHLLARGRWVVGPTEAGGVWFLGLPLPQPDIVRSLTRSGGCCAFDDVIAQAAQAGIEFEVLGRLRPIINATDLWLAAQQSEALKDFLNHLKAA
jgi:glycosyltransferase A (GT-A) superfamily protein (DUF2064 family)